MEGECAMKKARWLLKALVLGSLVVLQIVPITTNAGSPITKTIVISAESTQEVNPAVVYNVYNVERQEYLVVFWNDRPGCDDIRAERISRNGTRLGGRWIAAGCPAERRHPDVAYNFQRKEYLIVWEEESGGNSLIQSQRFTENLEPLPEGVQTLIAGPVGMYTSANPVVEYAWLDDKYLVVWQLEVNMPPAPKATSIAGHVVLGNGTKDPAGSFNVSLDPGGVDRIHPDIAHSQDLGRYLVVWQQKAGAGWDVYGQLVEGGGGLFQGVITIAWYVESSVTPSVAALPTSLTSENFLVVWEALYVPPTDSGIYGKLVQANGTVGNIINISAANGVLESSPAVVGMESNYQFFVTWRHPQGIMDKSIRGRAIANTGVLLGDTAVFPGLDADYPAVAAGPAGDYLIVWQDQPLSATNRDIYGQLWGNRVYVPLVQRP
jgi:hypothetical protein